MNQPESIKSLAASVNAPDYVAHARLLDWVREIAALTKPSALSGATARKPSTCGCARSW